MLLHVISTLFSTQTFHFLVDCMIYHTTIWLPVQKSTFLVCSYNPEALTTETISYDNKTQAKSSKRGILRSFIGVALTCPQFYFNASTRNNPYINNCAACFTRTITKPMSFYLPVGTVKENMKINAGTF